MKIGMVASAMIAGLIWLSILQFNSGLVSQSGRQTLQHYTKVQAESLSRLMDRDIMRVGFGVNGSGILHADSTRFEFETDFENNSVVQTIEWSRLNVTMPDGREEFIIIRRQNADTTHYSIGATEFNFRYFDSSQQLTTTLADVSHIGYLMLTQSREAYGEHRERHAINRVISPRNLRINS